MLMKHLIPIKFKEAVKDCKLIDSSDEYLVKWLVGMAPSSRKNKTLIHSPHLFLLSQRGITTRNRQKRCCELYDSYTNFKTYCVTLR